MYKMAEPTSSAHFNINYCTLHYKVFPRKQGSHLQYYSEDKTRFDFLSWMMANLWKFLSTRFLFIICHGNFDNFLRNLSLNTRNAPFVTCSWCISSYCIKYCKFIKFKSWVSDRFLQFCHCNYLKSTSGQTINLCMYVM